MLEATQTAGGPGVFEAAQEWEGQTLVNGNYRLRQYLGGSDHSAVFLTDIGVGQIRTPAIKLIAADPASAEIQLARWKMAAKLSHPNLLQTFEAGRCQLNGEELLFVVMENADETLSQILLQRALTSSEVREMLKPTLEVLAYVHENGCAHGRVKPSNIMAVGEQLELSSDSLCRIGTPAILQPGTYDSPEASLEGLTPAGDIWSLGMTMTEALTQRAPIWSDKLQGEPSVPEGLPEPFFDIARGCLVRDPRKRWTVADISAGLKQPDSVAVRQQADVKSKSGTARSGKANNNWFYAIPVVAMLATVLMLSNLLRHRPAPQSSSPAPIGTATPAATPPVRKPSGYKDGHSPRTTIQAARATSPVVADHIVHRVLPDVPEKALGTIHGKVRLDVKVIVDGLGNVTGAELASAGPSKYFANLATQAARNWKFDEGRSERVWLLRFVFEKTGVTAHAQSRGA